MDLKDILLEYYNNKLTLEATVKKLSLFSIEYVERNIAQLDINRNLRRSVPEVVLALNKRYNEIIDISNILLDEKGFVVVSKIKPLILKKVLNYYKKKNFFIEEGQNCTSLLIYDDIKSLPKNKGGKIGIMCAGTSDIGIAEEVRIAAMAMGCNTFLEYDVGIAGIQRLLESLKRLASYDVDSIVVVAGMEGALPSVVTSLVNLPVIGVPTSIGYGFGASGLGAMASMLQSCTLGLAIVNVDNGIGGGIFASLIAIKDKI